MLSIVVLCFKSEEKIIFFLEKLQSLLSKENIKYELILVGNYIDLKTDNTPLILENYSKKYSNITTISEKKKGGMGWDAISGLKRCSGDTIAFIDGDGQYAPVDIIRLYKIYKDSNFEFVKTYREERLDGTFRKVQSNIFNIFFRILFPSTYFKDINSKPKMFSTSAYKKMNLSCNGWFLDGEIILEINRLKLQYKEIPTVFKKNDHRNSFVNKSAILEMIISLIKYRFIYFFKR